MKFWRHLAVVLAVVAAVVAFGVAWEHSSAAGWITPRGDQLIGAGGDGGTWFNPSDVSNLTTTVEIVAAVMAGVIVLDVGRRRWRKARRARRAAASARSPGT